MRLSERAMAATLAVISALAIVLSLSLASGAGAGGLPVESPERSLAAVGIVLGGLGLLWSGATLTTAAFARRDE